MDMPKLTETFLTERKGIDLVSTVAREMRCIWRETPIGDIGIDGQIELFLPTGEATSFVIAAQVKCGVSYFDWKGDTTYFRPEPKHIEYWRAFPLPVLLILVDPSNNVGYWADARRYLRSPEAQTAKTIPVSRFQRFEASQSGEIFGGCGPSPKPLLDTEVLAKAMLVRDHPNGGCPLNFAEMFLTGLVDIGFQLFFSMSLVQDIIETKHEFIDWEFGWGIGYDEYVFIESYIHMLVEQKLVHLDYTSYLNVWEDREMVPTFIVPLTHRGREVIEHLTNRATSLGFDYSSVASERLIRLIQPSLGYERFRAVYAFVQSAKEKGL
jgi:hypothetical protein